VNYRITEADGWVVVNPTGRAENNEPLRVRHLLRRWLSRAQPRVIINLCALEQFGVWEVGLLISFKKEVDQRAGVLRLCQLDPKLNGYFHNDRFTEQFEIYPDLETAMAGERSEAQ
jgi:anti-anti-sigma factor